MQQADSRGSDVLAPDGRVAGVAIVASAVLALCAIALHPTVRVARGPADVLAQLVALSTIDEIVHGILIVLIGALLFGFTVFSQRRGLHRGFVLFGLIGFALASVAMIGAALLDGFVTPVFGARYAGATPQRIDTALNVLVAVSVAIQVLTKFAIAVTAIAVASWSFGLVRLRGASRTAGVVGLVSAVVAGLILVTTQHLNPHSLGILVGVQAIWYGTIGTLLIRGDL
jgi:hypothetical protein